MMSGDLLKATYADLKTVKTRSSLQIILEMPIEALTDVVALLGAPVPGNEVWVAVARLKDGATAAQEPEALPPPRKGTLAQQAGILCNEPAFQLYVAGRDNLASSASADECAEYVRSYCHVGSRADLDKAECAARLFRDLRGDYKIWLSGMVPA